MIDQPDILIFEGLNVLQTVSEQPFMASDFFDFSIYLDADTRVIEDWYVRRFLSLQQTAFRKPTSYFHHYAELSVTEAEHRARDIWRRINLPNLQQNILPTRERARVIMHKSPSHAVDTVWMRQI